jgi:tRNA(adenine34) deaminase
MQETWMNEALELAEEASRRGEVPVGAVVVLDDQVIGRGFNQPISAQDPTAHAEIEALRDAARATGNYRLPGADLYVTVEPCTMCAGALVHARIRRLVFGAREPRAGAVVSSIRALGNESLNHQVEVIEGLLAEECSHMMSGFFQQKRG